MKVYVIVKAGQITPDCYTSIEAAASEVNVTRQTLSAHINKSGHYKRKDIQVQRCEVVKIKGRGSF